MVKCLVETKSTPELTLAAEMSLRTVGKRNAANIVDEVSNYSPERATKMKKPYSLHVSYKNKPNKMCPEEALAFFVDKKLTKDCYISMGQINKAHNADIYPNYHKLLNAKKECYPSEIKFTDFSAEINLQSLLDHTIKRIFMTCHELVKNRIEIEKPTTTLNAIFKCGCDGASAQKQYALIKCFECILHFA